MTSELLAFERPVANSFVTQSKPFWISDTETTRLNSAASTCFLPKIAQIVKILPSWETPSGAFDKSATSKNIC